MDTVPTVRSIFHNQPDHVKIAMVHATAVMLDDNYNLFNILNSILTLNDETANTIRNCFKSYADRLNQLKNDSSDVAQNSIKTILDECETAFSELYNEHVEYFNAFASVVQIAHRVTGTEHNSVIPCILNELLPLPDMN